MKRDPRQLTDNVFDLLVIGGGIYGAFIAWDAVSRGLSVAMIEKGDFGHATSANSLKVIHGGLRCLQQGDILRMRRLQKEQQAFIKIAPHLIRPIPFLIPTYKRSLYSKTSFLMAFKLRKLLSRPMDTSFNNQQDLLCGHLLSRKEMLSVFPDIPDTNLTGSAVFYDCLLHHPERLLLSVLHSAVNQGAEILNYTDVDKVLLKKDRVTGVQAVDLLSKTKFDIKAKMVVNATGPWINRIIRLIDGRPVYFPMARGINLVIDHQLVKDYAVGIPDNDFYGIKNLLQKKSRLFFIIPWHNYSLIGSHYIPCEKINDNSHVTESEINRFLAIINRASGLALKRENVLWAYSGYVSIKTNKSGKIKRTQKKQIFDHQKTDHIDGMISVFGMKYTEARYKAQKVVDLVFKKLGRKSPPCRTAVTPVHGGEMTDMDSYVAEKVNAPDSRLNSDDIRYLISNYGTCYSEILRYLPAGRQNSTSDSPLSSPLSPIDIAEIRHSVDREMAVNLQDVMFRRTLRPFLSQNRFCYNAYGSTMAHALSWDDHRHQFEIQELKDILCARSNRETDSR